jgi:hypothetical protein
MSELQMNDVRNLFKSVKDIDMNYIKQWVNYLGIDEIYKKARE